MQPPESIVLNPSNDTGDQDLVQIFQLDSSQLRGRVVKLTRVLDEILTPHNYPTVIEAVVAEAVTLMLSLSSMLKYEGIFTLQLQGEGPLRVITADVTSEMHVRAYAGFDEEAVLALSEKGCADALSLMGGKGVLSFTVDQGEHTERYQGVVSVQPGALIDTIRHYFTLSDQVDTDICCAVEQQNGRWTSGAILLQRLPLEGGHATNPDVTDLAAEQWRRACYLLATCKSEELLDRDLHSHDLLFRLFHEEGVRVHPPSFVQKKCRCSRDHLRDIIVRLGQEEIDSILSEQKGRIETICQFCSAVYHFTQDDFQAH